MDAHDQATQQQESYKKRAAEGEANRNSEDRNAPITAVENQLITAEHHAL